MIRNFNADGFSSLYRRTAAAGRRQFTLVQRREIKKIARSGPVEHGLPFSTSSLSKVPGG